MRCCSARNCALALRSGYASASATTCAKPDRSRASAAPISPASAPASAAAAAARAAASRASNADSNAEYARHTSISFGISSLRCFSSTSMLAQALATLCFTSTSWL